MIAPHYRVNRNLMTERYTKNYHVLGIQPGASWKELRRAYKGLVNLWHPDRFQQNSDQKKLAEEKTKEITQSYKELAEYYKNFGVLPIVQETVQTIVDDAPSSRVNQTSDTMTTNDSDIDIETIPASAKHRYTLSTGRIIFGAALIGIAYFIWQWAPEKYPENAPSAETSAVEATTTPEHRDFNPAAPTEKSFTLGTPLGEVYAIQGIPTKTEKDIWYYGNSKIYFSKGRVARWEESPDHPLRAKVSDSDDKPVVKFFSTGSSREEVLAAQGAPDRDVGNVWDYGVSRVYFDKDRVSGWHNSPLNPLKIRR